MSPSEGRTTVWQRLYAALLPVVQGETQAEREQEAQRLTRALHSHVVAERRAAS